MEMGRKLVMLSGSKAGLLSKVGIGSRVQVEALVPAMSFFSSTGEIGIVVE